MMSTSLKILVQFAQHLPLCPQVFAQPASFWIFYPDVKLGFGPPLCCYIPAKGQGSVSSTCSATLSPAELIMGSAHWLAIAINSSAVFILTWPPWMCLVLLTLTEVFLSICRFWINCQTRVSIHSVYHGLSSIWLSVLIILARLYCYSQAHSNKHTTSCLPVDK